MKVSDKHKRLTAGLARKGFSATTPLKFIRSRTNLRKRLIEEIRARFEQLIAEHGHYVQFVGDGQDSFVYSCGRNDKSKPDFVACGHANQCVGYIVNEVAKRYDEDDLKFGVVYESEILVTATDPKTPTKYKLVEADIDYWRTKALGVFSRYQGDDHPKLIEIIIPDRNNNF